MKCIDMTTEFAKAPNFFGMGQRSRSSLLSQVQEARQKRGIPRPVKTNIVPESDSKHCKSTIVCLKDFLEGLLVTCAAFQHALSSVYCSISFTRDLHCEPSQVCQRLRAAFTRHLHPHPWKVFGTMENINIKTHSEKCNLLGCSTSSSSDSFPPAILQCQSPLLVVLMSVGSSQGRLQTLHLALLFTRCKAHWKAKGSHLLHLFCHGLQLNKIQLCIHEAEKLTKTCAQRHMFRNELDTWIDRYVSRYYG